MINICNSKDGFTLIEAMIAMVILSIGILALFPLHTSSTSRDLVSNRINEATALANIKIDQLKGSGFGNLVNGTTTETVVVAASGGSYLRRWVISDVTGADTKQIDLSTGFSRASLPALVDNCDHVIDITTFISDL